MRGRRLLIACVALAAVLPAAHAVLVGATRMEPPAVEVPPPGAYRAWDRVLPGVREVYVEGPPEAIGANVARLLHDTMVADESELWGQFAHYVPSAIARMGILDWSRLHFRHMDAQIPAPRRREIAAEAAAFSPDPFASKLPTYQRMVFLDSLYDVALSFEHSPLIGCTSVAVPPPMTADGHTLVARTFDFEAVPMFDRDKVVYLVREEGAIPFASVAWPGFVGVVSGMNAEGVTVFVHGGRARTPSSSGIPVPFSLREVLERAHDTDEAVAILESQPVMVSHIVFVADARGRFAVVERAPGAAPYARTTDAATAVTNHFEGPLCADPSDARIRATTSTLARRARADELLGGIAPRSATPWTMLTILRDHQCGADAACPIGDRRAIDADIAAHGVVADTTARVLWVSSGPHLAGVFRRIDVRRLLESGDAPPPDATDEALPADPSRAGRATLHP